MVLDRVLLENVLVSADPTKSIHAMIGDCLDSGIDGNDIYDDLESIVMDLRNQGRDDQEDIVLGGLDFLCGWCNPIYSFADRWTRKSKKSGNR